MIAPNSPEAFAVCKRIRDAERARRGFLTNPVTQLPETRRRKRHRRKSRPRLPAEQILEVYRLTDKGLSGREIAEAVGTSKSTIWRLVSQRGVYELMAQQEMEIKGVTG